MDGRAVSRTSGARQTARRHRDAGGRALRGAPAASGIGVHSSARTDPSSGRQGHLMVDRLDWPQRTARGADSGPTTSFTPGGWRTRRWGCSLGWESTNPLSTYHRPQLHVRGLRHVEAEGSAISATSRVSGGSDECVQPLGHLSRLRAEGREIPRKSPRRGRFAEGGGGEVRLPAPPPGGQPRRRERSAPSESFGT